jgi:putative DNA primase/helicase
LKTRGKFLQPESGKDLLELLDETASPVRNYVQEACVLGPKHEVAKDILYESYSRWCERHGHHEMESSTFSRDLFALGRGIRPGERGGSSSGARQKVYKGIELAAPATGGWRDEEERHPA